MLQVLKNHDKRLDHDEIDMFLGLLKISISRQMKELEEEKRNLSTEQFDDPREIDAYKSHLEDIAGSLYATQVLGDELSILALYKKIEVHTIRVVKKKLPSTANKNLSIFSNLKESLLPIKIESIDGYSGFNELRLINNSIKHSGKVSSELAKEFPHWKKDAELSDLESTYQRLLPEVERYVSDLTEKLYAHSL